MFSTGELARRIGTTLRTVRFYEEAGLLAPARDSSGRRRYTEADVERLRLISDLRELDLSIEEIRELLSLKAGAADAPQLAARLASLLAEQLLRARRRLEAVGRLEAEFASTLALLGHCRNCSRPLAARTCASCEVAQGAPRLLRVVLGASGPDASERSSSRPDGRPGAPGARRRVR